MDMNANIKAHQLPEGFYDEVPYFPRGPKSHDYSKVIESLRANRGLWTTLKISRKNRLTASNLPAELRDAGCQGRSRLQPDGSYIHYVRLP